MEKLLERTAAYKIFCGDADGGRLSHAYMLYFSDKENLRAALKFFALKFFGCAKDSRDGKLIISEGLPDMKIYPRPEKKLTAEAAGEIVDDASLKPVERDKKLYIISNMESASPIFQNKLLKVLEEPPEGVHFLLGTCSVAPVLDTVKSRVKTLEIPPFTEGEIFAALQRQGDNPLNERAAKSCGGVLGVARNLLLGDWYAEVCRAAREICSAGDVNSAVCVAAKYGDFKYKNELLCEMQREYFSELTKCLRDGNYRGALDEHALIYAAQSVNDALADVKFNANFSSLLCDFALRVARENRKNR